MERTGRKVKEGQIRLLICEDHRVLADALSLVAGLEDGFELVAEPVPSAEQALELVALHRPDVVLMDVNLSGQMGGLEATRLITAGWPGTKVVVLTAHDEKRFFVEAVEAGAAGFLTKGASVDEVLEAARLAVRGEMLIDQGRLAEYVRDVALERALRREMDLMAGTLTEREKEILAYLAEGFRNDAIAEKLFISRHTVQTHIRNILVKLGVRSKLEAVAFAAKSGVL